MSIQIGLLIINENNLVAGKPEIIEKLYQAGEHDFLMPPVCAYLKDKETGNESNKCEWLDAEIKLPQLMPKSTSSPPDDFIQKQWQYWNGDFPSVVKLRKKGYGIWILVNRQGYASYALIQAGLQKHYMNSPDKYEQPPLYVKINEKDYLNIYLRLVWQVINEADDINKMNKN